MRKHIKRLHFQCDKIHEKLFCRLNRDLNGTEHNYNIEIRPSMNGGYRMSVYLALKDFDSYDILVYGESYPTVEYAEKDAVRVILELEKCNLSEEITEWKKSNVSPIFNETIEHIGDVYTDFSILKKDQKSFDYYNTNPLKHLYGKFYKLNKIKDKVYYDIINSSYDSVSSRVGNDKALLRKMLNKINNVKSYTYMKFKN